MRDARSLALTGAVLVGIGLGAWAIPTAQAQTTSPALATGWWSQQPLAQPVADDGFEVGWALEQEQSMAAVRVDTSAAAGGTVYLALKEVGGSATDQGFVEVCVTTEDTWTSANPGPYADRPEADCAAGPSVQLGRDPGAMEWLGDITSLAGSGGILSLAVRPVGKPLAGDTAPTAPFSVQFRSAELRVEDPVATGSATEDTTTVPPYDVGGGTTFSDPVLSYPDVGSGLDTPSLPPVETPAAPTETAAGPSLEEQIALGPVDVTESGGRPWGRVIVLTPLSAGIGALTAAGRRWRLDRAVARGQA